MNRRPAGRKKPSSPKSMAATQAEKKSLEEITLPKSLTVKHLADLLDISPIEVIKHLMRRGTMANVNQTIDHEIAAAVAMDLGRKTVFEKEGKETQAEGHKDAISATELKDQKPRPPVITILGHVDHGKTSLLDAIRHSNVTDSEVGEITQHIGAYQVTVNNHVITFLDTPGHEAFTTMRARGAKVTDIAVLVIAADDGIMPQTLEAIDHVRAAEVPIIVAINKIDKPNADVERVKQQLTEHSLIIEEWGGDVIAIPVSAKTGEGLPQLLEHLLIVAELAELKANPDLPSRGVVIEAKLDNTKGTLATLLVQSGTLRVGDTIVVGNNLWGKVKAMQDDNGNRIQSAQPSTPVEIMGLSSVPQAGDLFEAVLDEHAARTLVEKYDEQAQLQRSKSPTLDNISHQVQTGEAKGINLIIKADVQGSIEPIKNSLEQLENDEVKVRIVRSGSGNITESDVMLAVASKAIIIGFSTRVEPRAKRTAEFEGIEIRNYQIIYKLIDDIEKTITGMLEPTYVDVTEGHAEIRALFSTRAGKIAGCYITDGKASRNSLVRILRNAQIIHESKLASLKHFKDNVSEMSAGSECGIGIEGFSDFAVGDILEFYRKEKQ